MDDSPGLGDRDLLNRLKAEGYSVGIIGLESDRFDEADTDVRIVLDVHPDLDRAAADVFLMESGLSGLVTALDIAWESARICKQNASLYGGAAVTNLATSLLGISPAPLSGLVNAITMAGVAGNSLRPLMAERKSRNVRRLPEVAPAGAGEQ